MSGRVRQMGRGSAGPERGQVLKDEVAELRTGFV